MSLVNKYIFELRANWYNPDTGLRQNIPLAAGTDRDLLSASGSLIAAATGNLSPLFDNSGRVVDPYTIAVRTIPLS